MRPLTPNGDIVKRQFVDPLAVSSREGIYEVARGIALRMAWNRPDAYEKAKQGDWSFVEWEMTPFYTQYKIPWTKDSKGGPLMFAAVRTLIDEWYHRLLSRSERYIGWRRYFSLTSDSQDTFALYGKISKDNPIRGNEFSVVAQGVVGFKGGRLNPFLPERLGDLHIDCGRNAIAAAATMAGVVEGEISTPFEGYSLQDVASYNFTNNINPYVGHESYNNFKKNPLALYDDWEVMMASLVERLDRCYWAMMDVYGNLAHPPVKNTMKRRVHTANILLDVDTEVDEETGSTVIVVRPTYKGVSAESEDVVKVCDETDSIKLKYSDEGGSASIEGSLKYTYGLPPEYVDVYDCSSVSNVTLNRLVYDIVYYVPIRPTVVIEDFPAVIGNECITVRESSLEIAERYDIGSDRESGVVYLFERIDADHEGGYHLGEARTIARDDRVYEAYNNELKKLEDKIPASLTFGDGVAGFEISSYAKAEYRFDTNAVPIYAIYSGNGSYIGTIVDTRYREPPVDGGRYEMATDYAERIEIQTISEEYGRWKIDGQYAYSWGFEVEVKHALMGRSDIPL